MGSPPLGYATLSTETAACVSFTAEDGMMPVSSRGRATQSPEQRVEQVEDALPCWGELEEDWAQSITQRRQALADDLREPHSVETVSRVSEAAVRFHAEPES